MGNKTGIRRLGLASASFVLVLAAARCDDSPTAPVEPPVAADGSAPGGAPQQPTQPPTPSSLKACFTYQQVLEGDALPCTVAFDAACSAGEMSEYRWFFEGGLRPDLPLPDTNITTTQPQITYSWGRDEECFSFRHFDRIVRLTVVDGSGATDAHEETVVFSVPVLRH
jgi:hypothetical protein